MKCFSKSCMLLVNLVLLSTVLTAQDDAARHRPRYKLIDIGNGVGPDRNDSKGKAVVAALEVKPTADRFAKTRRAGQRDFIPGADLPVHAARGDAASKVGVRGRVTAKEG